MIGGKKVKCGSRKMKKCMSAKKTSEWDAKK